MIKVITHTIKIATAVANAAGIATLNFGQIPFGQLWFLEYIRLQSTSLLVSVAEIYEGYVDPTTSREFTVIGNNDAAGLIPPLYFADGSTIVVQWTNCTAASQCIAIAQVRMET